jgi:hypothetical protein
MLPSARSDIGASLLSQANQASPGQSLLRKGKFRCALKDQLQVLSSELQA